MADQHYKQNISLIRQTVNNHLDVFYGTPQCMKYYATYCNSMASKQTGNQWTSKQRYTSISCHKFTCAKHYLIHHAVQTWILSVINWRRSSLISTVNLVWLTMAANLLHWVKTIVNRSWEHAAMINVPWENFLSPQFGEKFHRKLPLSWRYLNFLITWWRIWKPQCQKNTLIHPAVLTEFQFVTERCRQTDTDTQIIVCLHSDTQVKIHESAAVNWRMTKSV